MIYEKANIQGIRQADEVESVRRARDNRSFGERFLISLKSVPTAQLVFGICGAVILLYPALCLVALPMGGAYYLLIHNIHHHLPLRMPSSANSLDWGDLNPLGKPSKARGILLIGTDRETGEEVWLDDSSLRTHAAIFGTTGSGKTELLLSIVANALTWSSGCLYTDGKADSALWAKISYLAKRFGRDDDLLLLSYLIGNTKGYSNTTNFLANGPADNLTNLLTGLMSDAGGNDGMWRDRANSLAALLLRICVDFRDRGLLLLNVSTLRQFMSLNIMVDLSEERDITAGLPGTPSYVNLKNYKLDPATKESLQSFLKDLAGFDANKAKVGKPQSEDTNKQFSFCSMQFTKVLGTLADTYSYIFSAPLGDVDMEDVVLNRRILLVMLPSLEKSVDETESLGKIVIAMMKGMMGNTLMSEAGLEGSYADVIDNKQTNSSSPFPAILDEIGYYCVPGLAVQFAQARSLGFSIWIGGQDLGSMKKKGGAIEKEVDAMLANANLKACGKLEDAGVTYELFVKTAGEGTVTETAGYSADPNGVTNTYFDRRDASLTKRNRVDLRDLVQQTSGMFHFFFGGRIIRSASFFADPKELPRLERRRFLMVRAPIVLEEEHKAVLVSELFAIINGTGTRSLAKMEAPNDSLTQLVRVMNYAKERKMRSPEQSCVAIASFLQINDVSKKSPVEQALLLQNSDDQQTGGAARSLEAPHEAPLATDVLDGMPEEMVSAQQQNGKKSSSSSSGGGMGMNRPGQDDQVDALSELFNKGEPAAASAAGEDDIMGLPPMMIDTENDEQKTEIVEKALLRTDDPESEMNSEWRRIEDGEAMFGHLDPIDPARRMAAGNDIEGIESDLDGMIGDFEGLKNFAGSEGGEVDEEVKAAVEQGQLTKTLTEIEKAISPEQAAQASRKAETTIAAVRTAEQRMTPHPPRPEPIPPKVDVLRSAIQGFIVNYQKQGHQDPESSGR